VQVLVTESTGPAVFGTRRARVLVPRWLLELDAPLRELVLRHEQEHCRARDPQLTLTVAVALVLMPWNAGVWWIAQRLRLAVELDCDARVLRGAHDTERYSKLLLFIAQRQSRVRLAPMLAESNSHLGRRIVAMNSHRPHNPRTRIAALAIVAAGAIAFSTKFAAELTAAPTISLRDFARHESTKSVGAAAPRPRLQQIVDTSATTAPSGPRAIRSTVRSAPPAAPPKDTNPVAPAPKAPSLEGVTGPGNRVAMAIPGSASPRYPDILKQAGVEGGVLVAFVVDTSGNVDPGSIKFFVASHQLFAESVKAALPSMRFLPAMLNYVKVKQVVRLPIVFNVVGSALNTEAGYRAVIEKLLSDDPSSKFMTLGAIVITGIVP
jgi:TonB family protein